MPVLILFLIWLLIQELIEPVIDRGLAPAVQLVQLLADHEELFDVSVTQVPQPTGLPLEAMPRAQELQLLEDIGLLDLGELVVQPLAIEPLEQVQGPIAQPEQDLLHCINHSGCGRQDQPIEKALEHG